MPYWLDEAYASINAAYNTPNLTQLERAMLINEARFRAQEGCQELELTKEMKEILYGQYNSPEKGITAKNLVVFHSIASDK